MQVSSHPALHMLPMLNTKMTLQNGSTRESSSNASATTTKKSPATSPTTMSRLPNLQYAISHRRTELRLPAFARGYDSNSNQDMYPSPSSGLQLSMTQCETPHYTPGVPSSCPETSPTEKKALSLDSSISSSTKKKGTRRGTLNAEAKNVLKAWMFSPEHFAHPYPSEEEKEELANEAGIEVKQLSNWFTNARKRLWQPVLRQSGVEVKNFLSTGRGGPRGNKLEIPANLQQILAQHAHKMDMTPPDSPMGNGTPTMNEDEDVDEDDNHNDQSSSSSSPLKRSWSDVVHHANNNNSHNINSTANNSSNSQQQHKRRKDDSNSSSSSMMMTMNHSKMATVSKLSQELRLALADAASPSSPSSSISSNSSSPSSTSSATIQELEILAAKSLIGLCQQPLH